MIVNYILILVFYHERNMENTQIEGIPLQFKEEILLEKRSQKVEGKSSK